MSSLDVVDIFDDEDQAAVEANPTAMRRANFLGIRGRSLEALSKCTNLSHLHVCGIHSTGFNWEWSDTTKDFEPLRKLPGLRYLSIHRCCHFDEIQLSHVAKLLQLRGLSLSSPPAELATLAHLPELRILQLGMVRDLTFLDELRNLEHFYLSNNQGWGQGSGLDAVAGLELLTRLPNLKSVTIQLSHLRKLPFELQCETHFLGKRDKRGPVAQPDWWDAHVESDTPQP